MFSCSAQIQTNQEVLFSTLAAMLSPTQDNSTRAASTCPFCGKTGFRRVGNHLPQCREGRDNSMFLSNKTINKKANEKQVLSTLSQEVQEIRYPHKEERIL